MKNIQARRSLRERRLLATVAAVVFLMALDSALLTVALPAIMKSFPAFSQDRAGWVISGYSIALAAFLLPAGYVVDRVGRKAVLTAGLAIFCLGAIGCAISVTINQLILARCLQALGGACALPASLTFVLTSFHPSARPAAVGKWSAAGGLATALGPPLGAALIYVISWRAVLWVHIPVTLVVLGCCQLFLDESKGKKGSLRLALGTAAIAAAVGYLVALVTVPRAFTGLSLRQHGVCVMGLVVLGGYFVWSEPRFRRDFAGWKRGWVFMATLWFGAVFGAVLVAFDLILIYKFAFSIAAAALMLSPIPLLSIPAATVASRLQRGASSYRPLWLGVGALSTGAILFAKMCSAAGFQQYLCTGVMVLFACGIGLCFPALTIQATQGISQDSFALGCALMQALRHVGTALGVAIITFVLGSSPHISFTAPALAICVLCVGMAASLALGSVARLPKFRQAGSHSLVVRRAGANPALPVSSSWDGP